MFKTTVEPKYDNFWRGEQKLSVPVDLDGLMTNLSTYASKVNSFCLCDNVNGNLAPNMERTESARRLMIERAPAISGSISNKTTHLVIRTDTKTSLDYEVMKPTAPIEARTELDYIVGRQIAVDYARAAGVCTPEQFGKAEIERRIVPFTYRGRIIRFRNLKLYLLAEINALKGSY